MKEDKGLKVEEEIKEIEGEEEESFIMNEPFSNNNRKLSTISQILPTDKSYQFTSDITRNDSQIIGRLESATRK